MPKLHQYNLDNVTELDIAYLAGFVDGEGCFYIGSMINVSKSTGKKYPNFNCSLKISNNDHSILEWITETFGGRITKFNKNRMKDRNHFTYEVYMTGNLCHDVSKMLIPFLKVKKEQAKIMVQFRETFPRTGSRGPKRPSDAVLELRSSLRHEMTRLNSRFKNHIYVDHFRNLPPCCPST